MEEGQELLAGLRAGPHAAKHAACGRGAARLLHAAHHHAEMRGFHDDTNTERLQDLRDRQSDLFRETLLDLESSGEHLRKTSQLRQTQDTAVGDIADMHL